MGEPYHVGVDGRLEDAIWSWADTTATVPLSPYAIHLREGILILIETFLYFFNNARRE